MLRGFEVYTIMYSQVIVFWVMTPCSNVVGYHITLFHRRNEYNNKISYFRLYIEIFLKTETCLYRNIYLSFKIY